MYFYLNNDLELYTYNQSNKIKDFLYSSIIRKIILKISTFSFLFKIILKLLDFKNLRFQNNNLYTIY